MKKLTLLPGSVLIRNSEDGSDNEPDKDLASRAIDFLFNPVNLGLDLHVGDIFGLFEKCPALLAVYGVVHAHELCAEARQAQFKGRVNDDLDYLELRYFCDFNSHTKTFQNFDLDVSLIGPPIGVDEFQILEKDGSARYSTCGVCVGSVLHLPIRYRSVVTIVESDQFSTNSNREISQVNFDEAKLGDILFAVLRNLSWSDDSESPEEEVVEDLVAPDKVVECPAFSAGQILREIGIHEDIAIDSLFQEVGPYQSEFLAQKIKQIPDAMGARLWLKRAVGRQVRLAPKYRRMTGRELREAFYKAAENGLSEDFT